MAISAQDVILVITAIGGLITIVGGQIVLIVKATQTHNEVVAKLDQAAIQREVIAQRKDG